MHLNSFFKINLFSCFRVVEVLDDSARKIPTKYLVIEWIEGNNLNENNSKFCNIKDETDFIRMTLLILREIDLIHEHDHFHCDIRPENIVVFQYFGFSFYMLIDFGSGFKKGEEELRVITFSQGYTPNDNHWTSESDIYSLGKEKNFFFYFFFIYFKYKKNFIRKNSYQSEE